MGLNRRVTREAERWMWRLSPSLKGSGGGYITFSRKQWVLPADLGPGHFTLCFKFEVACGLYLMPSWSCNICAPLGSCKNRPRGQGRSTSAAQASHALPRHVAGFLAAVRRAQGHWAQKPDPVADGLPLAQEAPWRTLRNTQRQALQGHLNKLPFAKGHLPFFLSFHQQANLGPFHK